MRHRDAEKDIMLGAEGLTSDGFALHKVGRVADPLDPAGRTAGAPRLTWLPRRPSDLALLHVFGVGPFPAAPLLAGLSVGQIPVEFIPASEPFWRPGAPPETAD